MSKFQILISLTKIGKNVPMYKVLASRSLHRKIVFQFVVSSKSYWGLLSIFSTIIYKECNFNYEKRVKQHVILEDLTRKE